MISIQPKSIEDLPLLSSTIGIIKFCSALLVPGWRCYLFLVPYIVLCAANAVDFSRTLLDFSENAVDVMHNGFILLLFLNCLLRGVMLSWNRTGYEKFMQDLCVLYVELTVSENRDLRRLLNETTKLARTLANVNLLLASVACIGFIVFPIFEPTKALPYAIYVPGVDKYQSPFYEILYAIQGVCVFIGALMYIPFTNLIVTFILFAILMCKVLQQKLRSLANVARSNTKDEIVRYIKYQLKLVRYLKALNRLTTYIFFVEFLGAGAMLCAMMFLVNIVDTMGQRIIAILLVVTMFSQCMVMYYYADELYAQSQAVAVAAYDTNWYEFDLKSQKMLKLFILHAQKPCAVLICNVYPMNLTLLQSLLNVTYTYFTLLQRVYG